MNRWLRGRRRLLGWPRWCAHWASCCALLVLATTAVADASSEDSAKDRLLVTVNGHAICERHVTREIDLALAQPQLSPNIAVRMALERPTLELLIDRRLVLVALRREKRAAADAEIDVEIERRKTALARRNQSLDEFLAARRQTADDLRDEIAWRLSWRRIREAELNDAAIAAFFDKHRRQFDGTRLRVSHILFALPQGADAADERGATERAAKLRSRIAAGEISFAEAAKKFSDAPTKDGGGDIGVIARRGEQHESFAAAAFALAVGEISPPTRTPHGVHLIQCTAEEPGKKMLAGVREVVVRAATTELFRTRADAERTKAKIEYADRAAASNE